MNPIIKQHSGICAKDEMRYTVDAWTLIREMGALILLEFLLL